MRLCARLEIAEAKWFEDADVADHIAGRTRCVASRVEKARCAGLPSAPEKTRTSADHTVHKALDLERRASMLPLESRSSKCGGFVEALDAMDTVDVFTAGPHRRPPRGVLHATQRRAPRAEAGSPRHRKLSCRATAGLRQEVTHMVNGLPDATRVLFDDERAVANAGRVAPGDARRSARGRGAGRPDGLISAIGTGQRTRVAR